MNKDNREIEIKIKIPNPEELKKKILDLGGKKTYESLNQDIYFDNSAGFYDSGHVLRVRREQAGTLLTFKYPLEPHKHLLQRGEIQTRVEDGKAVQELIEALGYKPKYTKEKIVEYFDLEGVQIEFHKVPFLGNFIEIEENEKNLDILLQKLGLDMSQGIPKGLHTLFEEYLQENNLPKDTEFSFAEEKKHHLQK